MGELDIKQKKLEKKYKDILDYKDLINKVDEFEAKLRKIRESSKSFDEELKNYREEQVLKIKFSIGYNHDLRLLNLLKPASKYLESFYFPIPNEYMGSGRALPQRNYKQEIPKIITNSENNDDIKRGPGNRSF